MSTRRKVVVLAISLALILAVAVCYPTYVKPQIDPLRRADAIVVLGGHGYDRYSYGIELALTGYAPRVVMSNPAGAQDLWLSDLCSEQRYDFQVDCFEPSPATTRGEARAVKQLAAENHWETIIVVTFTPHISRARATIERCYDGALIMTAPPTDLTVFDWTWNFAYQSAGYIRAALQRGC